MRSPLLVEDVDIPLERNNDISDACPMIDIDEWTNGSPNKLHLVRKSHKDTLSQLLPRILKGSVGCSRQKVDESSLTTVHLS
jgi:hypothetical protein